LDETDASRLGGSQRIIASLLARTGYDAPRKIFEGGHGLYRAFLRDGNYSLEKLTDELGKRWETRQYASRCTLPATERTCI